MKTKKEQEQDKEKEKETEATQDEMVFCNLFFKKLGAKRKRCRGRRRQKERDLTYTVEFGCLTDEPPW